MSPLESNAPAARRPGNPGLRILAMFLRHYWVITGSWPRLLEMMYWPTVQIVLWGFLTQFLATNSTFVAQAFGVLLSGAILWDVLFRGQLGVSVSFLEEMWSRNLAQLFISPLRTYEFAASLMLMSLFRTLIGIVPASVLAMAFFGFNVYELGFSLVLFFANLIVFGWALALAICGLILRFGMGAENLAWTLMFALAPICGIYYPISTLPEWLQMIALALPASHVFEGMRAVMVDHVVRWELMGYAAMLNIVYLVLGSAAFFALFEKSRESGQFIHIGE